MLNGVIVLWDCLKTYEDNILTFIHELFTAGKNQWRLPFSTGQREYNGGSSKTFLNDLAGAGLERLAIIVVGYWAKY